MSCATPTATAPTPVPETAVAAAAERRVPADLQAVAQEASDIARIIDRLASNASHDARCATADKSPN